MKIGVPKEIKTQEYRVGLTPESVMELTRAGHDVFVQTGAGLGLGATDADYVKAGAKMLDTAADVFATAEMIVKVKEPQPVECAMLKPHHTLFTYLHLAADKPQAEALMKSGATCIAYETVTNARRPPAAAAADEPGRGPHVDQCRRLCADEDASAAAACCSAACRACRRPMS